MRSNDFGLSRAACQSCRGGVQDDLQSHRQRKDLRIQEDQRRQRKSEASERQLENISNLSSQDKLCNKH